VSGKIEQVSFRATVVGVAGDPPLLHWRKLSAEVGATRPLSGAVPVPRDLLATARAIPAGTEAELVVETHWAAPGAPTRLARIAAASPERAPDPLPVAPRGP
jgi:hypothetical protein